MQLKESSCPSEAPAANHPTATVAPIRRRWIGPLGLLLLLALLLPAAALAQPEGGAVIVERKQSYHLGKLWVWTTDEGHVAVHGEMSPLFEMEMAVLNVTPAKVRKGVKAEKGNWNGTIGEPVPFDTELQGALPVLVRMNYRKLDRIDTRRQFHRVRIEEIPDYDEGAVLVECTLADDEEVRCRQHPSNRPTASG